MAMNGVICMEAAGVGEKDPKESLKRQESDRNRRRNGERSEQSGLSGQSRDGKKTVNKEKGQEEPVNRDEEIVKEGKEKMGKGEEKVRTW